MAIVPGDIVSRLSGGAGNADVNASIGGIMSSVAITDAALHNLFDLVTGAESTAGDIEYRCFYVLNSHATLTLKAAKIWITTPTGSVDTEIDIGLDPAGVGDGATTGVAATPADESTAPAGVTFTRPASFAAGLSIGDLAPSEAQAVWVRWTVNAGAAAVANDAGVLEIQGDTAA